MEQKIKVIVWKYESLKNVGHAAVQLSDNTYISWWPILKRDKSFKGALTAIKSVEAARDRTFEKDKGAEEGEGREPDETVEIPVTKGDEDEVKKWWNAVLADTREKYNLYTNNCSTMAYRALRKAYCFKAKNEPIVSPWTPNMVLKYAKQCQIDKTSELEIVNEYTEPYLEALVRKIGSASSG